MMKDNGQKTESEVGASDNQHKITDQLKDQVIPLLLFGFSTISSAATAVVAWLRGETVDSGPAILIGIGVCIVVFAILTIVYIVVRRHAGIRQLFVGPPTRLRITGALGVVVTLTAMLVFGLLSAILTEAGKSNFYIVEFSESMDGNIESAISAARFSTLHLEESDQSGLLIFGGNTEPPTGCNTAVQRFVNPVERDSALDLMANLMNQLQLINRSRFVPLQEAIVDSLKATNESSGRRRLQNLIIITTGEPTCNALSSEEISRVAEQLGIKYFLILLVREGRPGGIPALQDFVRQHGTLEVFLNSDSATSIASRIDRILGLQPTVYPQFNSR